MSYPGIQAGFFEEITEIYEDLTSFMLRNIKESK